MAEFVVKSILYVHTLFGRWRNRKNKPIGKTIWINHHIDTIEWENINPLTVSLGAIIRRKYQTICIIVDTFDGERFMITSPRDLCLHWWYRFMSVNQVVNKIVKDKRNMFAPMNEWRGYTTKTHAKYHPYFKGQYEIANRKLVFKPESGDEINKLTTIPVIDGRLHQWDDLTSSSYVVSGRDVYLCTKPGIWDLGCEYKRLPVTDDDVLAKPKHSLLKRLRFIGRWPTVETNTAVLVLNGVLCTRGITGNAKSGWKIDLEGIEFGTCYGHGAAELADIDTFHRLTKLDNSYWLVPQANRCEFLSRRTYKTVYTDLPKNIHGVTSDERPMMIAEGKPEALGECPDDEEPSVQLERWDGELITTHPTLEALTLSVWKDNWKAALMDKQINIGTLPPSSHKRAGDAIDCLLVELAKCKPHHKQGN